MRTPMTISRSVVRLCRPWAGCSAQTAARLLGPGRDINTGSDHVMLQKRPAAKHGKLTRFFQEMEIFEGKWMFDNIKYYKGHPKAPKCDIRLTAKDDPTLATYLLFQRNTGEWILEMSSVEGPRHLMAYIFYMKHPFITIEQDNSLVRNIIYPDGKRMKWEKIGLDLAGTDFGKLALCVSVMEISKHQLVSETTHHDGTKEKKAYSKQPQ